MDAPLSATGVFSKYDRQLRMWGAHGQNLLAQSRVCLLNASATGTEIERGIRGRRCAAASTTCAIRVDVLADAWFYSQAKPARGLPPGEPAAAFWGEK